MSHASSSLKQANLGSSGLTDQLTNIDDLDAKVEAMIKQADEVHQRVIKRQDGVIDETAAAIEQQVKAAAALTEQAAQASQGEHRATQTAAVATDDELLGPLSSEFDNGAGPSSPDAGGATLAAVSEPSPAAVAASESPSASTPATLSAKESLQRAIEEAMRKAPSADEIAKRLSEESAISQAAQASAGSNEVLAADAPVELGYDAAASQGQAASPAAPASEDEFADVQDVYAQAEASGQISMIEPPLAQSLQPERPEVAPHASSASEPASDAATGNELGAEHQPAEPLAEALTAATAQPAATALVSDPLADETISSTAAAADAAVEADPAADESALDAQLESAIAAAQVAGQAPMTVAAPEPATPPAQATQPSPPAASPTPIAATASPAHPEATTVKALDEQLAKALAAAGDDEFADGSVLVEDQSLDDMQQVAPAAAAAAPSMPEVVAAPVPVAPAATVTPPAAKPIAPVSPAVPSSASMAPPPPVTKTASAPPKPAPAKPAAPTAPPEPAGPTLADRFWMVATPVVEPIAMRLGKLPASVQQTAGWVGLSTLFVAACTWIYVIGFQPTLPASQLLEAERAAAAAAGGHGEKKSSDAHGQDSSHDEGSDKKSAKH